MKFLVGDKVLVTSGKDKGKQGNIVRVFPKTGRVVVEGMNMYTRHIKPVGERAGEKVRKERPLPQANIAILNDENKPDRIGYSVTKAGVKTRIYKKSGKEIAVTAVSKKASKKK